MLTQIHTVHRFTIAYLWGQPKHLAAEMTECAIVSKAFQNLQSSNNIFFKGAALDKGSESRVHI